MSKGNAHQMQSIRNVLFSSETIDLPWHPEHIKDIERVPSTSEQQHVVDSTLSTVVRDRWELIIDNSSLIFPLKASPIIRGYSPHSSSPGSIPPEALCYMSSTRPAPPAVSLFPVSTVNCPVN